MFKKSRSLSKFITLEGGEGVGKSTLAGQLLTALTSKGYEVLFTREPGGCKLGEKIRSLLLEQENTPTIRAELFLFLAARAQHVEELILPALRQGKIVLCDRFSDSTLAYQVGGRSLLRKEISPLIDFAAFSLVPDLTFLLDLDPKIGLNRSQKRSSSLDRIESEKLAFHERVRRQFLCLAKEEPNRIRVLDAQESREALFEKAWEALKGVL